MITPALLPFLEDIEQRIDPDDEDALASAWTRFNAGEHPEPVFSPRRARLCPARLEWPHVRVNQALTDFDAMALQQFAGVSAALAQGSGLLLNVRCNYGSSILPALFGVRDFIMEDALDTLPTSVPFNDLGAIQRLLDRGVPDLQAGWGAQVFAMGERFAEIARAYPKIGRYVHIYHPDIQGPLDVCEVVWGSSLFYALYDCPALVHALLALVVETYTAFLQAWAQIIPWGAAESCHWGFAHRGRIMLRDDSAMNLSPAMFAEFVAPYDQRLLDTFGGGAIHFCGRGDHYIAQLGQLHGLHAINLSQPELNQMRVIFANTIERGINLLGLGHAAVELAAARGIELKGRVHCGG
jgi:hypothetical protein